MRLVIGSDHGGFTLKEGLVVALRAQGHEVVDHGPHAEVSCDYPDLAAPVAAAVADGRADLGVLVCGSGIGMSIAANKVNGIRAALVQDMEHARLARQHNNANILCLGGRFTSLDEGTRIVNAWLDASYEGGRHDGRLQKIAAMERA